MKKILYVLSIALLLHSLLFTVSAVSKPEILYEPQNLVWPENSVASYSVEAYGDDLSYKWYIICNGVTYDTTKFEEGLPWTGFGMSGCGASADGKSFYINGILPEANGSKIYCEVSNSAGSVQSRPAVISVGGGALPPKISIVSGISVERNQPASIMCTASDPNGGTLEYVWMETATGELKDVIAINRGAETNDTLNCDASKVGTRYYVCMVSTSNGGMGYSSVVPVTVTESPESNHPAVESSLPEVSDAPDISTAPEVFTVPEATTAPEVSTKPDNDGNDTTATEPVGSTASESGENSLSELQGASSSSPNNSGSVTQSSFGFLRWGVPVLIIAVGVAVIILNKKRK